MSYLEPILVHPVRRQNFGDGVAQTCNPHLIPCRIFLTTEIDVTECHTMCTMSHNVTQYAQYQRMSHNVTQYAQCHTMLHNVTQCHHNVTTAVTEDISLDGSSKVQNQEFRF